MPTIASTVASTSPAASATPQVTASPSATAKSVTATPVTVQASTSVSTTAASISPAPAPITNVEPVSAPKPTAVPTLSITATPVAPAVLSPDPYITFGGTTTRFLTDCTGQSNCFSSATPIQSAIDFVFSHIAQIPAADRTIFVDGGAFNENVSVNAINTLALRGGADGKVSTINGSVSIANSAAILFEQFTVNGSVLVDNSRSVSVSTVVANSVSVAKSDTVTIQNATVTNGIQVADSRNVTVQNSAASNSPGTPAISIARSDNVAVNNVATDNSIRVDDSRDVRVTGTSGNDTLRIELNQVARLDVDGAPGNDVITLVGHDVLGGIQVWGGAGDDVLIVDNSLGSVIPALDGILYDGGAGFDSLGIHGGSFTNLTYTPGPADWSGVLTFDGAPIRFTSVEPITNTTGGTLTYNGTAGDDPITIRDFVPGDAVCVGCLTTITGGAGVELIAFANLASVIVNGAAGNDTITLNITLAGASQFTINGGLGNDIITIIATAVGATYTIHGDDGNDVFNLNGGAVGAVYGDADADTFNLNGGSATSLDGGAGSDTIVGPNGGAVFNVTGASSGTVGAVTFVNVENLTGGPGVDAFSVNENASISTLTGGDGNDIFNFLRGAVANPVQGGLGDDTYVFSANWGNITVAEQNAAGNDTLRFTGVSVPLSFDIDALHVDVTDTAVPTPNRVTHNGNNIERYLSGSGNDTFAIKASPTVSFTIDGGDNGLEDIATLNAEGNVIGDKNKGPPTTVNIASRQVVTFTAVEHIKVSNTSTIFVLDAAQATALDAQLAAFYNWALRIGDTGLLNYGIEGIGSDYDGDTGKLIRETLGGSFALDSVDPHYYDLGNILQKYLYDSLHSYLTGGGVTTQGIINTLKTITGTGSVDFTSGGSPKIHLGDLTVSAANRPDTRLDFFCGATCDEQVLVNFDYTATRTKEKTLVDTATAKNLFLDLNDVEALTDRGFSFSITPTIVLTTVFQLDLDLGYDRTNLNSFARTNDMTATGAVSLTTYNDPEIGFGFSVLASRGNGTFAFN